MDHIVNRRDSYPAAIGDLAGMAGSPNCRDAEKRIHTSRHDRGHKDPVAHYRQLTLTEEMHHDDQKKDQRTTRKRIRIYYRPEHVLLLSWGIFPLSFRKPLPEHSQVHFLHHDSYFTSCGDKKPCVLFVIFANLVSW